MSTHIAVDDLTVVIACLQALVDADSTEHPAGAVTVALSLEELPVPLYSAIVTHARELNFDVREEGWDDEWRVVVGEPNPTIARFGVTCIARGAVMLTRRERITLTTDPGAAER